MKSGYCTIIWNRSDCGASKMNHHQPHLVLIHRRWWCVYGGIGRESSIMSSFRKTKRLIPTSIALRPTKSSIQWKVSRISQQKTIFHQGNTSLHVSLMIRQKLLWFGWEVLIQLPYSADIASLDLCWFWSLQISLSGKDFSFLKDCTRHLKQFFAHKGKTFWRENYEVARKMAEGSRTKWWIHCLINFLVKMRKCPSFLLNSLRSCLANPIFNNLFSPLLWIQVQILFTESPRFRAMQLFA